MLLSLHITRTCECMPKVDVFGYEDNCEARSLARIGLQRKFRVFYSYGSQTHDPGIQYFLYRNLASH